ncbi:5-formyltetrahydrofolate cyclo-ligase [Actinopolyspora xinjiangensis]|uniref:5-formyltetrahydrofolate cyclo-ligase n=1 Tax=Actinopolyspora xinjiangensis TaxID=405564 RepID=A0A1H0NMB4_9ACTN|nr:5-formyltetrahydrofolate cyclo-ligase [Actinopolyspora xinjiangensis]SDO93803.1 5-formyltetrahydrofolate cyclo-ligase [Actinopolyspora xinjiangensis]
MTLSADELNLKEQWRRRLTSERDALSEPARAEEDRALRAGILGWLAEAGIGTVCAYVPVGSEPGSPELLDDLVARGHRVLLPVVAGRNPLEWAEYHGPESLRRATYGLLEPSTPHLGVRAVAEAGAVLVPALAVDREGVRLGKGAGFYDRSLPLAEESAELTAVVRDSEFVERLPAESHDVRVAGVITPARGFTRLPV